MKINLFRFGKRIAMRRTELGISQKSLSEKVCISPTHLSNIENGKSVPSFNTFIEICDELEVSTDYLLSGAINSDIASEIIYKIGLCSDEDKQKISKILDVFIK